MYTEEEEEEEEEEEKMQWKFNKSENFHYS